jgi:hypothetical protein
MHLVATTASRGQIKVWTFGNLLNLWEVGNKFVTAAVTWGYEFWHGTAHFSAFRVHLPDPRKLGW